MNGTNSKPNLRAEDHIVLKSKQPNTTYKYSVHIFRDKDAKQQNQYIDLQSMTSKDIQNIRIHIKQTSHELFQAQVWD